MSEGSLAKKVRTAYAQDAAFARSHRMVTWMMAFWAFTVIVDRGIGMLTNAYEQTSAVFPLAGAAILLLIAFLGTQGHLNACAAVSRIEHGSLSDPICGLLLFL